MRENKLVDKKIKQMNKRTNKLIIDKVRIEEIIDLFLGSR